jgi:transposase
LKHLVSDIEAERRANLKKTIAEWMSIKGVSKVRLAADTKVSIPTVYRWFKDPGRISFAKGKAIADTLGVKVSEIIFLPEDETNR